MNAPNENSSTSQNHPTFMVPPMVMDHTSQGYPMMNNGNYNFGPQYVATYPTWQAHFVPPLVPTLAQFSNQVPMEVGNPTRVYSNPLLAQMSQPPVAPTFAQPRNEAPNVTPSMYFNHQFLTEMEDPTRLIYSNPLIPQMSIGMFPTPGSDNQQQEIFRLLFNASTLTNGDDAKISYQKSKERSGYISPEVPESEVYSDKDDEDEPEDDQEQDPLPEYVPTKKPVIARVNAPIVAQVSRDRIAPVIHRPQAIHPLRGIAQTAVSPVERTVTQQLKSLKLTPTPSIVFIYDIKDITQLAISKIENIVREFPCFDVAIGSIALHLLIDRVMNKYFNQDEDKVTVKKAIFDEYMELVKGAGEGKPVISHDFIKKLGLLPKAQEEICRVVEKAFQKNWQNAKQCLKAIADKHLKHTYANVVLCNDHVVNGAAQLLLTGLISEVPLENVYSTKSLTKEAVLQKIQRDFEDQCLFVVVTSDSETIVPAKKLSMPTWSIDSKDDMEEFLNIQRTYLLD